MRLTKFFFATAKEIPKEAKIISHILMLRGGLVQKFASGIYGWLPLGVLVLNKIKKIIREEMNKIGGMETLMPFIQPYALWQKSNRWDIYGDNLLKMRDRHKNSFCFGPTHEEIFAQLIKEKIKSYRQLPTLLYQIQTKFRDEFRPRFGVIRCREFLMKDGYSFHTSKESLDRTYEEVKKAYCNIFYRLKLNFKIAVAASGNIGGEISEEFLVPSNSGETEFAYIEGEQYTISREMASCALALSNPKSKLLPKEKVATVNQKTIIEVSNYLNSDITKLIKTIIIEGRDDELIAVVLRGDHNLNETKATSHPLIASPLKFVQESQVQKILGCSFGSIGPINLDIPILVDYNVLSITNFICGANEDGYHFINGNWERDVKNYERVDIHLVNEGDLSSEGNKKLKIARGIEVGHIFKIGDRYSKSLDLTILDEKGKSRFLEMGCFGIGVSRLVAVIVDQNHDEYGIIWPKNLTPFLIGIIPLATKKEKDVYKIAEDTYYKLLKREITTLFDDRDDCRVGAKFNDMDLIGIPYQIIVSKRGLQTGTIEWKDRYLNRRESIKIDEISNFIEKIL